MNTAGAQSSVLARGTTLEDRFEIVEFLGAGSFGEVYGAKQLIFGIPFRKVALKLFKSEKVTPENAYDVFCDAITLVGLQEEHPSAEVSNHLIQVYDVGLLKTPQPRTFMSMKLVPGRKTLHDVIRKFKFADGMPVALSLRYLRQILVPLAWMHSLPNAVVHGDLKPDNVLVTEESDLVLTDFGLAARLPIGSLGGAIEYQSPENLLGYPADAASDVYSLGLLWYEMLMGANLFVDIGLEARAANDTAAYIRAHQVARKSPFHSANAGGNNARPIPGAERNVDLSDHPQVEAMLARCLAYKSSERYPNACVLLGHVDKYLAQGHLSAGDMELIEGPSRYVTNGPASVTSTEDSIESRIAKASTFIERGDIDRAAQIADQLLADQPNLTDAMLLKARVLAKQRRLEDASTICMQVQKLTPKDPNLADVFADIREAEGKPQFAKMFREKAQKLRAESAHSARGRL